MRPPAPSLALALVAALGCTPDNVIGAVDAARPDAAPDAPAPEDVADAPAAPDAPAPDASAPDVPAPDAPAPDAPAADVPAPMDAPTRPDAPAPMDAPAPPDVAPPPDAPPPDRPSPMRDLSMAGPHRVAVWTGAIAGTQGDARVFYPMTAGSERYPLVAFAHGFQLNVSNYNALLAHVASWGYVVASVSYPGSILSVDHRNVPAALSAARRAFASATPPGAPAVRADATRAIAMGHSLGGKGAIMAVLSDAEFDACLALDPVDDNPSPLGRVTDATPSIAPERMGGLRRPLGLFGATQSRCASLGQTCAPEASDYRAFASAAPTSVPVTVWPLRDFGHMNFVDPGCGLACIACAGGSAPLDSRLAALRTLTVAFLERYARDDASMQTWLDGAGRASLLASGALWNGVAATLPACR